MAAWVDGAFDLVVSPLLVAELARVLAYPRLTRRITPVHASALLSLLELAEVIEDADVAPLVPVPDADDVYLVVLARQSRSILVTGDKALLALAPAIPVESPSAFLDRLV